MKFSHTSLAAALLVVLSASSQAALIISQYYEGASNDKYIEITNTGSTTIDLAAGSYYLGLYANANREAWKTAGTQTGSLALTGELAAGASLVYGHASAAAPSYAAGSDINASGVINFNGDDSIVLYTGSTYAFANVIDVFGVTANSFGDTSYVRNSNITTGTNTDFNASDWTQYTNAAVGSATAGATEYLGSHVVVPEPSSVLLGAVGLLGILRRRR